MAILNKYKKKWKTILSLRKDNYYDFVLSLDNASTVLLDGDLTERCLINYIDTNNPECIINNTLLVSDSEHNYENAVNNNLTLDNIGFTGIDTSLVRFDKDTITDEEFIDLVKNTTLQISSGDTRLQLQPVSGNTKLYDYPCEIASDGASGDTYYKLNGGFLQGFYKTCDNNYDVLPQYINGAWNLEFVIRPRSDYQESGNTLNTMYPENKGIFFYMGTRAENKFAEYYGCDLSEFPLRTYTGETVTSGETNEVITTSEGHDILNGNTYDVATDNGYLIYNRTCDGYTTYTWKQGDFLRLTENNRNISENLFLLMNRTCNGLTTDKLEDYVKEHPEVLKNDKCDIKKDLIGNAFALKVNENGSIGYKYLIKDCDNENGWPIKEENGFPGTIQDGVWNVINVMFKILDGGVDDCGVPLGERKMKMYIYVNGYLKFVSQELPEFNFRELNDYCDKQEGVAYNISLGGGTQGLIESVWLNKMYGSEHIFPLEQNFAGSFIGDIRSFKFYDCQLQYNEIKNNYLFETVNQEKPEEDMVKDDIIYFGFNIDFRDVPVHGNQMKANKSIRNKYMATSEFDDAHFYVVISKKYIGSIPYQFTCGGAPMVMFEKDEVIDGKLCTVYESGEIYAPGTELIILSDNQ